MTTRMFEEFDIVVRVFCAKCLEKRCLTTPFRELAEATTQQTDGEIKYPDQVKKV